MAVSRPPPPAAPWRKSALVSARRKSWVGWSAACIAGGLWVFVAGPFFWSAAWSLCPGQLRQGPLTAWRPDGGAQKKHRQNKQKQIFASRISGARPPGGPRGRFVEKRRFPSESVDLRQKPSISDFSKILQKAAKNCKKLQHMQKTSTNCKNR